METLAKTNRDNGAWWLFELLYGAEKTFLFNNTRRRNTLDLVLNEQSRLLAQKIKQTIFNLDLNLIGSEVTVEPLSKEYEPIDGILTNYNLQRATITLGEGRERVRLNYGKFVLENSFVRSTGLIVLSTDQEYRF